MRLWPGSPYPLGATWDGSGVNFALFSEHATKVELCLFDSPDAKRSPPASRCPSRPTWSGTATCRTCCPASSTATASTGRTSRPTATASTRTRSCSIPTPRRSAGEPQWADAMFGYTIGDPDGDLSFDDARQRRLRAAGRGDRPGLHLGRRPAAAHALAQDGDLRAARQGLHAAAPRRARDAPRHLRRPGVGGGHPPPAAAWASRRSNCCRSTITSTTGTWSSAA